MTVNELITQLQRQDGDAEIEIMIGQYNKHYPVAYVPISDSDYPVTQAPDTRPKVRIAVSLPNNMRTSVLKEANGYI